MARAKAWLECNEQQYLRSAYVDVAVELPKVVAGYAQARRVLQPFEDFCLVTQSVRRGMTVNVTVRDATGERMPESTGIG